MDALKKAFAAATETEALRYNRRVAGIDARVVAEMETTIADAILPVRTNRSGLDDTIAHCAHRMLKILWPTCGAGKDEFWPYIDNRTGKSMVSLRNGSRIHFTARPLTGRMAPFVVTPPMLWK